MYIFLILLDTSAVSSIKIGSILRVCLNSPQKALEHWNAWNLERQVMLILLVVDWLSNRIDS